MTWISRSFRRRPSTTAGLFLDDERFVVVRESLPMPVYPSYDFIDVLSLEGQRTPAAPGVRAA